MTRNIYLIIGFIFMLFFSCSQEKKLDNVTYKDNWYEHVPPKTSYIFIINKKVDLNSLPSSLIKYYLKPVDIDFISKFSFNFPINAYVLQKDEKLKSYIVKGTSSNFEKIFNEEDGVYNGVKIFKNNSNNNLFYGIKKDKYIYISNSRINLENFIRMYSETMSAEEKAQFINTSQLLDYDADYNIIQLSKNLKPDVFNLSAFHISPDVVSEIEAFDAVDLSPDIYTGIALSKENKMMGIFNDISGVDHEIYNFIPKSFTDASHLSFDNFSSFYSTFSSFFEYKPFIKNTTKSLFNTLKSITFLDENYNKAMILQFKDASDFIEANPYNGIYNNYKIYKVKEPQLVYNLFRPILKPFKATFFTSSNDYIIITENKAYLKKLINDFDNRNTLINQKDFKELAAMFPSGSQYETLKHTEINAKNYYVYKNYKSEDDNVYINLLLKEQNSKNQQKSITHLGTVKINDIPVIKPKLIYNHKNKTYRIIYQNQNNELVYRNLSGKVLWKRKYEDRIIGKILPIDLFQNRKTQYTFVTKNKWYIIDRYGRNIDGYPIKFKNKITQPLSVFDYNKNRVYRFGIVQGKNINLYNKKGKLVKGFKYKSKSTIISPITHYRIRSRDYLVTQTSNGKLIILDRRGNIRIPVKEKFENLIGEWKAYNNKFINISKNNDIFNIDVKGKLKKTKLSNGKPVKFDAISNLFAVVTDDKLILNGKSHELELGSYHTPYIYKTKKALIFLSREDNNKIYVFDSKGKPVSFSPIIGQQILDIKALGNTNYILSYDSDHNLMVYRFK